MDNPNDSQPIDPRPGDVDSNADDHVGGRVLSMVSANDIDDDVPEWVWSYKGEGRILKGALTLFAGRPGAGKSTAARYFSAAFSRGGLDGVWRGQPQNVAYIAAEEAVGFMVKPSLRAVDADLDRIFFPTVTRNDKDVPLLALADEDALTDQLLAMDIRVVVVDPIMATIGGKVDAHRNNETREHLDPWLRIAERIGGTVIGVVHLKKERSSDILAAIQASSAFGEVARCVFGFVTDDSSDEGNRVMSQIKNSCGIEDLSKPYRIDRKEVTTDSGKSAMMGCFSLSDRDSDITVSDILRAQGRGNRLSPEMEAVKSHVELRARTGVQGRHTTTPRDVVSQGLARDNAQASQRLGRLHRGNHIAYVARGIYGSLVNPPAREDTDENEESDESA